MQQLQNDLDIKKWLESEKEKKDLCGTYDFCIKCDKTKETPCAVAYTLLNKKRKRISLSFEEKLAIAKEETKQKFKNIEEAISELKIKLRICKKNVTLRYNKKLLGLITLTKNSLKIHLAIQPNLYEIIPHIDYSDKKTYEECPFTIKITSKRSIKNAISLLTLLRDGDKLI